MFMVILITEFDEENSKFIYLLIDFLAIEKKTVSLKFLILINSKALKRNNQGLFLIYKCPLKRLSSKNCKFV